VADQPGIRVDAHRLARSPKEICCPELTSPKLRASGPGQQDAVPKTDTVELQCLGRS
jgi:hypothetical protein